jgi:hypothetical protein
MSYYSDDDYYDYYYTRLEPGLGYIRKPLITSVIGNFDDNNNGSGEKEEEGCLYCGIVLEYSDKAKRKFCFKCGWPLTAEELKSLAAKDFQPATIDEEKVLPNNDIRIDKIGGTSVGGAGAGGDAASIRRNEEGFTPMKRGANSDAVARREQREGVGSGFIAPLRSRPEKKKKPTDPDIARIENQGGYVFESTEIIPKGGMETYNPQTQRAINERERQYRRRTGRPEFEVGEISNQNASGLNVGGSSSRKKEE